MIDISPLGFHFILLNYFTENSIYNYKIFFKIKQMYLVGNKTVIILPLNIRSILIKLAVLYES